MPAEFALPKHLITAVSEKGRGGNMATVVFDRSNGETLRVLNHMRNIGESRRVAVHEGSPVYLWPNPRFSTQQWDNRAFIGGHEMVVAISQVIPPEVTRHVVLIDEYNGKPRDAGRTEIEGRLTALYESSSAMPVSPIFNNVLYPNTVRFAESSFQRTDQTNTCSSLDSGFQIQKMLIPFRMNDGIEVTPDREQLGILEDTLLVVVHPNFFQKQQKSMLRALVSSMDHQFPFSELTKPQRRLLISKMYRHVWLDDLTGEIVSVTKPVWSNKENKFVFQKVDL